MDGKRKDVMLAVGAIVAIVLIGYLLLNIDTIFPAPAVDLSVPQVSDAQFNIVHGTNPNATVTFIEFGDFECPSCKDNEPAIKQMLATYGNKINFVFKHFPISDIHPDAERAGEASECARDQGKFWEYHDKLYDNQDKLGGDNLLKYAQDIGMDGQAFAECLQNGHKDAIVQQELVEGIRAGVRGTPTFFINGKKLEGIHTFDELKNAVDSELNTGAQQ